MSWRLFPLAVIIGALAAAWLGIGGARAQECQSYEIAIDSAKSARDSGMAQGLNIRLFEFDGDKAQAILKAVNAVPPETDIKAQRIIVLEGPSRVEMAFEIDGCVRGPGLVPMDQWKAIERAAFGDGA